MFFYFYVKCSTLAYERGSAPVLSVSRTRYKTYALCSFMCGIGSNLYQASLLWPGLSFERKAVVCEMETTIMMALCPKTIDRVSIFSTQINGTEIASAINSNSPYI